MGCRVTTVAVHLVLLCATDRKHGIERAAFARNARAWWVTISSALFYRQFFLSGPSSGFDDVEHLEETLYGVLNVLESS